MEDAAASATGSYSQHDSQGPTVITQTQAIDISQMPLPPLAAELEAIRNQERNSENAQIVDTQPEVAQDACTQQQPIQEPPASPKAAKKKNHFKFSNERLMGGKVLFLNRGYESAYSEKGLSDSMLIVGRVIKCPTKSSNVFVIAWEHQQHGMPVVWMQSHVEATKENKELLKVAVQLYQEKNPAPSKRGRPNISAAGTQVQNNTLNPAIHETPPQEIRARHAAVASLCTCASVSGSTISTLTNGTGSSSNVTRERTSRHDPDPNVTSTVEDSDSDDGDDVDEQDNAWYTLPPHQRDDDNLPYDQFAYDEEEEEGAGVPKTDYVKRLKQLEWKFKKIDEDEVLWETRPMFEGPEGAFLRPGVGDRFADPFECFQSVGGLDRKFMARLTRNSNSYFHNHIKKQLTNKQFHGKKWQDIKIPEMYRFFGIMLRISISPVDAGGYPAYVSTKNIHVAYSNAQKPLEIHNTEGFATQYMDLWRFKQIRSAFYPEEKASAGGGDKCYQLRHLIEQLNAHSKASFVVGRENTFDEGGVGCRSRMCPCRQYNGSKPQKFRVDFFIWACAKTYAVLHLDVYQGKNGSNVGIHPDIHEMPTTQKVVMNAGYALGLHESSDGARHCTFDNRYGAPELAVLALEVLNLCTTATVRQSRVGWGKDLMCLTKKEGKGSYLMSADKINRVVAAQWVDSKVVSVISTLNLSSVGQVFRRVGAIRKEVDCPDTIRKYQQTMFGVDKGDQIRMHGGAFARKAHFQKWYKRAFFAIVDCMLLNSLIAWNMAASAGRTHKQKP